MTAVETKERELLTDAIFYDDTKAIEKLVAQGVNLDERDKFGYTPLILAANDGKIEIADLLIEKGAKLNYKSADGETALHAAIRKCDVEMTRLLLDRGALITEKGKDGSTPLICAIVSNCLYIVELLLERGADPDERDEQSRTAFEWATNGCEDPGIKTLMKDTGEAIQRRRADEVRAAFTAAGHTRATMQQQLLRENFPHKLKIRAAP